MPRESAARPRYGLSLPRARPRRRAGSGRPCRSDPSVEAWYESVAGNQLYLSVLTLAEIRLGVERARGKDPAKAAVIENWLTRLESAYGDHIVAVDTAIADAWARLSVPDPLPVVDGLLAATASVRNWTLVTRNTEDVARPGVRVLNPFTPA